MKKNFFRLLSAYAPTSQNKASYDEHVSKFAKRLGVDEIRIDNNLLEKLFGKFIVNPKPIIISGSAGDGKTYLLRKLFSEMGGESECWSDEYIPKLEFDGKNITFIKDFTEIEKEDKIQTLMNLYKSIYEGSDEVYIIASNDGILTDTLRDALSEYPHFEKLLDLIEESIDNAGNNDKLILLDLSQTSSSKNFELLLKEILLACDKYESHCPSLHDDTIFCPIHANIEMLKKEHIQKQLIAIVRSCDLNYQHITLRKLFMLISNMILGYKEKSRVFNSCEKGIEHFKNLHNKADASFYYNVFGDNLPKSKQEKSPFKELRELRIGYETSNYIDDFILYGDIENKELYHKELNNIFFDFETFFKQRENYLENGEMKIIKDSLVLLRRHLFFNYDHEIKWGSITIDSKDLIAYKHAQKFYDSVISPLRNDLKVSNSIVKELVLGLNRVFLGELLSKDGNTRLFVATSLTGTHSKLSSEIIEDIGFNKRGSNQGVELELLNGFDDEYCKVMLNIRYGGEIISSLELDLHMFEFLQRISDG
ncbi:MAG: Serine-rich protein, partial [uncultured Sulfurovum sp.]